MSPLRTLANALRRVATTVLPAPLPPLPNNRTLDQYFSDHYKRGAVAAAERPQIKAVAGYWRQRLVNAAQEPSGIWSSRRWPSTQVRQPLTEAELDYFEQSLAFELAGSWVILPNQPMFQPCGADIALRIASALRDAGAHHKVPFVGYLTRVRILQDEASHELGPYMSGNWQRLWPLPS